MEAHSYFDGTTVFLIVLSGAALVVTVLHCIGWMRSERSRHSDDFSTQQLLDSIRPTTKGKE